MLLGACGDTEPTPVPATATPPPTVTPVPTQVPEPTSTPSPFRVTIADSNGNQVTFDKPPERIVAYDSSVVEILFAIGEGHRVVGTHDLLSHPPEAADVVRLGDAFNVNLEAAIALEPDLVFIFSDGFLSDFERVGLKVLYQKSLSDDFTQIADNIRMWGRISGGMAKAQSLAEDFETRVANVRATLLRHAGGATVFQDEGDLWSPGPNTLIGEVFDLLKLENISHDVDGYAQLSPEIIVDRDPELIIASYGDTISDRPAFSEVAAVKDGRVYVPGSDALSVQGPRFIEGVEALAKFVYPDLFE